MFIWMSCCRKSYSINCVPRHNGSQRQTPRPVRREWCSTRRCTTLSSASLAGHINTTNLRMNLATHQSLLAFCLSSICQNGPLCVMPLTAWSMKKSQRWRRSAARSGCQTTGWCLVKETAAGSANLRGIDQTGSNSISLPWLADAEHTANTTNQLSNSGCGACTDASFELFCFSFTDFMNDTRPKAAISSR